MSKAKSVLIALISFLLVWVLPVGADEIGRLRETVQVIQEENRILKDKLKNQEAVLQEMMGRLSALEVKEAKQVSKKETITFAGLPQMKVQGFADIGLTLEKADNSADSNPSTFTLGEFDFIVTSDLSDKVNFFSENVIEFEQTKTEIDVERLYIKYSLSDLLNIWVGRIHTPMGYWNTVFHHGKWFQNSISRPLVAEYEHDGGILPLHLVGVNLSGNSDIGLFDLEYNFGIGNGRDNVRTRVQNVQDRNDAKAFNTLLTLKPHEIPGLRFGFNAYVDKIPANNAAANRDGEIKEIILGGYFAYQRDNLEVLFEGYNIKHDDEVTQRDYDTTGLYLQTSYKLKEKWTPYYRFDFLRFGQGDPYYSSIDINNSKHTLGLRWDISNWNALKLEYGYSDRKNASDKQSITINDSFHF